MDSTHGNLDNMISVVKAYHQGNRRTSEATLGTSGVIELSDSEPGALPTTSQTLTSTQKKPVLKLKSATSSGKGGIKLTLSASTKDSLKLKPKPVGVQPVEIRPLEEELALIGEDSD